MSKKNRNRSISESFKLVLKKYDTLKQGKDGKELETINELEKLTKELLKFFKGFRKILLMMFSLLLILTALFCFSVYKNIELTNINSELENQKVDSIMKTILDIKETEVDSVTTRTSYKYQKKGDKIVTYRNLLDDNDSLQEQIDSLRILRIKQKSQLSTLRQKLEMAKDNYGINFREYYRVRNGDTTNYIQIQGKKVDSAMMLLEHYRKNLTYNKDEDLWYITEKQKQE